MKLLLTGISGFVGSNLTEFLLSQGHIVYGLDIVKSPNPGVKNTYSWDRIQIIPQIDAIIHLAGMAHDTKGVTDDSKYFDINVGLTKKIFKHYLNSSAQIFIYFSSVKAVADSVTGESLTEDIKPNPKTPYGKSKLEAENYIKSQTIPADKKIYILRPAMIHGPGNKGNLNLLFAMVQKGLPYPLGNFKNRRSFTSISNMIFIVNILLSGEIKSGTYNICDDDPLSTVEIVEMIYDSLGKKRKILNIPKSFIQKLAKVGNIMQFPLNSERLQKLTESYVVSNREIKRAISVKVLPTMAHDGMLQTINSFKQ